MTLSSTASRSGLLLGLALVVSACGAHHARVRVSPHSSLADEPVEMTASGLPRRSPVSVTLSSTDSSHVTWSYRLKLTTDRHGALRVPMSAITSMLPALTLSSIYTWRDASPLQFQLRVDGQAPVTFERRLLGVPVSSKRLTFAKDGLDGEYFAPKGAKKHAAILLFGGSEGGLSSYVTSLGLVLAGHGYPVLTLAYFADRGLPPILSKVPLEYFARGLHWLSARPEVDPTRLVTYGISRGSEAAQLVAAYYPQLVHAVVASVPGNLIGDSAWSYRHKQLRPFAPIPVERIRGPIFALCATKDTLWPSCPQARAILARHKHPDDVLAVAHGAGHFVSARIAYEIFVPNFAVTESDADGREVTHTWPALLHFLARATA